MNNDLISREDLKAAFEKVYPLATNEMGGVVNKRIYEIINNAPTVSERTQGEWKFNVKWQDYECPFCNEWVRPNIGGLPNFCPNCGAKMKGGKE